MMVSNPFGLTIVQPFEGIFKASIHLQIEIKGVIDSTILTGAGHLIAPVTTESKLLTGLSIE